MAYGDLDFIVQAVHRITEGDVDYPTSTDDDYTLIKDLSNDYLHLWESEEGTLWNELWGEASFASTGATSYSLSSSVSDMRYPGGYVYLDPGEGATLYWKVIKPEEAQLKQDNSEYWCYFTGNQFAGFTLVFNPNIYPSSGGTIKFPYYKKVTELSTGASKVPMSDPYYVVHGVASNIIGSEDPGESNKQFQLSQSRLKAMKTLNLMVPYYQSNQIKDRQMDIGRGGFGV